MTTVCARGLHSYSNLLNKLGQYFLDIQYIFRGSSEDSRRITIHCKFTIRFICFIVSRPELKQDKLRKTAQKVIFFRASKKVIFLCGPDFFCDFPKP